MLKSASQRKHILRWLRSRSPNYVLDAKIPWLTFDAVDELRRRLPSHALVFEYGSGGSTLFWLKQGAHCTSVEHDEKWFAVLQKRLGDCKRLDYRLIPPDQETVGQRTDPVDPQAYRSTDPAFADRTFKNYVQQIDEFPNEHFDVVLVDGRARPSCLMHAAPKVKHGGLLILDNAERNDYTARTRPYLQDFVRKEFPGAGPTTRSMWRTDIYQRP
ncbi:MAG TPA: hypothetical protein VL171_02350 [Verrucomicrobiae bacterium]|nr:hypothetical protein [Verrucomicrobiae bacterium]